MTGIHLVGLSALIVAVLVARGISDQNGWLAVGNATVAVASLVVGFYALGTTAAHPGLPWYFLPIAALLLSVGAVSTFLGERIEDRREKGRQA
jgi:hypothetical protein